jgi:L-threonylcarbamoyladenylate synthase
MHSIPEKLQNDIEIALKFLRNSGVVGFPTDTLYGIGARSLDPLAVERIYTIKRRSRTLGLPLLLGTFEDMERVAIDIPQVAHNLAAKFWPGPLTLVLKKAKIIPAIVTGGNETVAIRVPNHPVPRALVAALGDPITGTSANKSGHPGAISALEVWNQLGDSVDHIIDGGLCPIGVESTILDLTGKIPRLLRQGSISIEDIQTECDLIIEKDAT